MTGYWKSKNVLVSVFVATLLCFLFGGGVYAGSAGGNKGGSKIDTFSGEINPNRVIVKFKSGVATSRIDQVLSSAGVRLRKTLRHTGVSILEVVDKGKSIKRILKDLDASGIVEYAEPDYLLHADVTPNDPRFGELWGLHNTGQSGGTPDADIDAPEAWDTATGSADVVVAVIDSGVDYNHEDLAANMWTNPGEIPANEIDDDHNGYVDDVYGIDTCNGDSDPFDDNGHGTHCSGTIGAVGDNSIGVVGVNWDVRIMTLKFLSASGSGWTSDAIECLEYGIMMETDYGINLKLTSNSWGGGGFSQSLYDAIEASGNAGMLFVAAAGNSGSNNDANPHYPSSYDLANIIAVAATDRDDDLAYFSCYGPQSVDLGAPGQDILSTTPGNSYSIYSGTSMATPHVSGAAALLWSINPSYGHSDTKGTLLCTVDPLASLAGMVLTGGRLNIDNAINCAELRIDIQNNSDRFYVGDVLETSVSISNTTEGPIAGDIWAAIQLPNGTFRFYPDFSTWFHPAVYCVNIPVGTFVTDYPLLTYTFPEGSEGIYRWYGVIVPCGADVRNPANWLAIDVEEFTVILPGVGFQRALADSE